MSDDSNDSNDGKLLKEMTKLAGLTGSTISEIKELKEIFQLVDTDGGGTISRDELESLMKTVGLSTHSNDLQYIMKEIDPAGSGEIDFRSFVVCVTKKVQTSLSFQEIKNSFRVLDSFQPTATPGVIPMKLLLRCFTEISPTPMSEDNALDLIREVVPQGLTETFDSRLFLAMYFEKNE